MLGSGDTARRGVTPRSRSMRAVVQRVARGGVTVDGEDAARTIGRGLVVLVGIGVDDDDGDIEYIARKVYNTKLWPSADGAKQWARSAKECEYDVLFISQFTLHAELKGNKPSYHRAASPTTAEPLYDKFIEHVRSNYVSAGEGKGKIECGKFGAMMDVDIHNDGPVTLILDSKNKT